jgi:hypothetical protein
MHKRGTLVSKKTTVHLAFPSCRYEREICTVALQGEVEDFKNQGTTIFNGVLFMAHCP